MKLYHVQDQADHNKFVFARSFHHAAEQFITWLAANGIETAAFAVKQVTVASQEGAAAMHLRDILQLGIEGIGSYHPVHGWSVCPIRDEREPSS